MFNSIIETNLTITSVLICITVGILLGLVISYIHMVTNRKYNKNFVITLALLPILVEVVMLMVNGNLGTSVAVLGAFSLIRFRSIPGNSREITSIFFAMSIGLALGMGQIWFAILLTIIISLLLIIFSKTKFGDKSAESRVLKIVIPEDLEYDEMFEDIFSTYTTSYNLDQIKTINMGSLFELKYDLVLRDKSNSKKFIDELRIRNGNMKITLCSVYDNEML